MRMEENRRFVRWKISRPARFRISGKDDTEEKMALLKDISFAGAQFSLSDNLRLNDRLDMFLEIPDEEHPVQCQGKVVWQKSVEAAGVAPFNCGLSFTQLKDKDKEKIFQYVRNSSPQEVREKWWEGIK